MNISKTSLLLLGYSIVSTGCAIFYGAKHTILEIHTSFAREQIGIIYDMRDQAKTEDLSKALQSLAYAKNYYRSGTKQVAGSKLDLIVETVRERVIDEIIDDLRLRVPHDWSENPDDWMPR